MTEEKNRISELQAPHGRKPKDRKNLIIMAMSIIILLLLTAFMLTATPLKELFFPARTAPKITLELVEGPNKEESGKYCFKVSALLSGNPTPEVFFSRDDSLGETGENFVVIFLDPGEGFTLTAAAVNSQGRREASLELMAPTELVENDVEEDNPEEEEEDQVEEEEAEEEEEEPAVNRNPIITGINLPSEPLFTNNEYTISAMASDPDGDSLSYRWEFSGPGTIPVEGDYGTGNPIAFRTPDRMGRVTITVTVRDGHGGEAVYSEDVTINLVLTLMPVVEECGWIQKGVIMHRGVNVIAGDGNSNDAYRGFISFNTDFGIPVSFTLHQAVLRLANPEVRGNPADLHGGIGLWAGMVYWGARPIIAADYHLSGTSIKSFTDYDIDFTSKMGGSNEKMAKEIQERLLSGTDRLQFRLHFAKETDSDGNQDSVKYLLEDISLKLYLLIELD